MAPLRWHQKRSSAVKQKLLQARLCDPIHHSRGPGCLAGQGVRKFHGAHLPTDSQRHRGARQRGCRSKSHWESNQGGQPIRSACSRDNALRKQLAGELASYAGCDQGGVFAAHTGAQAGGAAGGGSGRPRLPADQVGAFHGSPNPDSFKDTREPS